MTINVKKSKMTLDKSARMTANEFSVVRKDMNNGFTAIREEMATKDDLKKLGQNIVTNFATKEDLKNFATKDDVKISEVRILEAVDGVAQKFDKAEKDHAADKLLHDRHEKAIEFLKQKVAVR